MSMVHDQVQLGPYQVDLSSARVFIRGSELDLRPQAFHALRTLVENTGRYVDYDQMIRSAWHGTNVSRHTVSVTIGEVKKALGQCGNWIQYRPQFGYRLEIPSSEDLIKRGWHYWERQTREGFEKALDCFHRAAQQNPTDSRAYEGIQSTHLLLLTYGMKASREMFEGFHVAHARVVELKGITPELRADKAHALHVFERRFDDAEQELLIADREKPRCAPVRIRQAMLYATWNRPVEALATLEGLDPWEMSQSGFAWTEMIVRMAIGDYCGAIACGETTLDFHPHAQLARVHYGLALDALGRFSEAAAEFRMARIMSPELSWIRAMEAGCLAQLGRRAEALEALQDLDRLRETEYVDAYQMALLYDRLGFLDCAFVELERACKENSSFLFFMDVDAKMAAMRRDPRYAPLRASVFPRRAHTTGLVF